MRSCVFFSLNGGSPTIDQTKSMNSAAGGSIISRCSITTQMKLHYAERRSHVEMPSLPAQRRWRVPPIHYRGEKLGTESAPDADAAINSPLRSLQLRRLIRREGMFESIERRAGSKHVSEPAVL